MAQRIAVIADIHGNVDALAAALADIDRVGADRIVNLGDCLSGPLAARETADLLMARPDILSIRGNHDRYLLGQEPAEMGASDACAHAELSPRHLEWLASLTVTANIGADIAMCHATPGDDETYWLEALSSRGEVIPRDHDAIAAFAGESSAGLHLCAHTHLPRSVRLRDGRLIVNPGSIGCPAYTDDHPVPHVVQSGFPEASYAMVERQSGCWVPTFRRVGYDTARMAGCAALKGRTDWADAVATGWIAQ
jgi:predicted phosphodiesterase